MLSFAAPGAPVPPILPPHNGYLLLDRSKFAASFAGDVEPQRAAFMADSQAPWGIAALNGTVSAPAWKTKLSWYFVATSDKMIPPRHNALWRSARKRRSSNMREVTPCTYRSRKRSRNSSRLLQKAWLQDGDPGLQEAVAKVNAAAAEGVAAGI